MKKTVIALVLALVAGSAFAGDGKYDFVTGGYGYRDLSAVSGDSLNVGISKSLTQHVFVTGGYEHGLDSDMGNAARVGIGAHNTILNLDNLDLVGTVTAVRAVSDTPRFEGRTNYEFAAGIRHYVTDRVELRGGALWNSNINQNLENKWYGTAGAEYRLTKNLAVALDGKFSDRDNSGQLSARYYW